MYTFGNTPPENPPKPKNPIFDGIKRLIKENDNPFTEEDIKFFDTLKEGDVVTYKKSTDDDFQEDFTIESKDRENLKVKVMKNPGATYSFGTDVGLEHITSKNN